MTCVNLSSVWNWQIVSSSTGWRYVWMEWRNATGIRKVKFLLRTLWEGTGDSYLELQPAYQVATGYTTRGAQEPTRIGTVINIGDPGASFPAEDISTATEGNFLIRFGVAYRMAASGTHEAEISAQIATEEMGRALSPIRLNLVAPANLPSHVPVSEWMPSQMIGKACQLLNFEGSVAGDFHFRQAWQFAALDVEQPDAWSSTGDFIEAGGEIYTGETTVLPSNDEMWARLGIEIKSDTEDESAAASVRIIPAFRK